ncbi:hypothetical protein M0M57_12925 [Flavobacterium azooxidireducens]|uniref:Outer membrane protein beta-barrel domain-containing protein n=1 Tax=Flavobacterium azooxidireducens TaxID=1871076 RepID=A0ABY4KFM6_9FLAO|nr:hypothetical protein [Flavobacterium azooxidireducens]UPQ78518.1 hypothetical protein M0M57_12925 [Flavobacterium azooxidireducens]
MKKIFLVFSLFTASFAFSQSQEVKITPDNSWFKAGLNVGLPIGDTADVASFTVGADVRGQYLVNPSFGIGIASGYNHFFGKDEAEDFGLIPLAGFARYYAQPAGLFVGADFGYGFLTNANDNSGGLYLSPQIGYHNEKWNFYGYYQHTFAENDIDIQVVGLGVTYNIMF